MACTLAVRRKLIGMQFPKAMTPTTGQRAKSATPDAWAAGIRRTRSDDVPRELRAAIAKFARDRVVAGESAQRSAPLSSTGPLGVLNLDALRTNVAALRERACGLPIRVASKSIRCVEALRWVLDQDGYRGVLGFSAAEAISLVRAGFRDVVVAYPSVDRFALQTLLQDAQLLQEITLMVDSTAHLDLLASLQRETTQAAADLRLCIDVDASLRVAERALGDRLHVGSRRSPIRTAPQAVALAEAIALQPGMRLVGLMAYEGQIAGVGNRRDSAMGLVMSALQPWSARELAQRRGEIVAAVRGIADLEFVNGGGTGSLESSAADSSLTELAAGSGLYSPGLFDGYAHFRHRPAAFAALPVVRIPGPGWVTVFQGGWVASGPAGTDRLPVIAWPPGARYGASEGPGEVQTPLTGPGVSQLRLGDHVFIRHAKAGELAEHLASFAIVDGDQVTTLWPTYRGEGWVF